MDGFGNINWWGFSPSVDLLKLLSEHVDESSFSSDETINILLINAGDQRHILETIASLAERKISNNKKVHFYVYEKMLELYARDFLLLSLALEHPSKLSLQEKSELYLEIYANLLVREYTSQFVQTKANEFIRFITDLEHLKRTNLRVFDFEQLKFKERDFLEGIFKFWRTNGDDVFPARKCWDVRLRSYFGNRYDSRTNAYDWDFSMKLVDRQNATIINNKVYSRWRETGVAFEMRDTEYERANKTLASGMVFNDSKGDKTTRRGFFGDIIVGPFLGYGIESTNGEFFKKQNDSYRYTSLDVSRDNLTRIMRSIVKLAGLESQTDQLSGFSTQARIVEIENEQTGEKTPSNDYMQVNDFKITFLPLTIMSDLLQKAKYEKFFHLVYMSNSGSVHMSKDLCRILKPNALVVFETAKFMIEMRNEQVNGFSERLKQIAAECKLTNLNKFESNQPTASKQDEEKKIDPERLNFLVYKFEN